MIFFCRPGPVGTAVCCSESKMVGENSTHDTPFFMGAVEFTGKNILSGGQAQPAVYEWNSFRGPYQTGFQVGILVIVLSVVAPWL